MRCTWCLAELAAVDATVDHVFPAAIGGTRELVVPACRICQALIRRGEEELSRRSEFALFRAQREFRPRNLRKDPESGSIDALYVLRRLEGDGYAEVAVQGGQPKVLPSIEVEFQTLRARTRGFPADIDHLAAALVQAIEGPGIGYCLHTGSEGGDEIAADPEFWPRVYLDLKGTVRLRARTEDEAQRLLNVLLTAATEGVFGREEFRRNTDPTITPAGVPHLVKTLSDERLVMRVIAKIAYGVAYRHVGEGVREADLLREARLYVRGDYEGPLVRGVYPPGALPDWPEHHAAVVGLAGGRVAGIVSLYGACHLVDLGAASDESPWQIVSAAICARQGGRVQLLPENEAREVWERLASYVSGAPQPED